MAEKLTGKKINDNFRLAFEAKKRWIKEAEKDYQFTFGKQWKDEDWQALKNKGVQPLTINKIRPNIMLLTGIESQNRSDPMAYPEHNENSLEAEVATALLKNVKKTSNADYKSSQQFEDGCICGESFLEPWIDYSEDLLNGDLKLKKNSYISIFPDPDAEEYDKSDGKFFVKITWALTKDQILAMFPDHEKEIENTQNGIVDMQGIADVRDLYNGDIQRHGYRDNQQTPTSTDPVMEPVYDLLEYYYKKYVTKYDVIYFIVDGKGIPVKGSVETVDTMKEADDMQEKINTYNARLVSKFSQQQAAMNQQKMAASGIDPNSEPQPETVDQIIEGMKTVKVRKRSVPQIWVASKIGTSGEILEDVVAPTYPEWPGYPFISFYCYWSTAPLKFSDRHLLVQGVARQLRSLNMEYNKRRTQLLRHINQSSNSGIVAEEGVLIDEEKWENQASQPGILLKVEEGKMGHWQRLEPQQLSQGHLTLAAEASADIEEASGIKKASLAAESSHAKSGQAISLLQKQGMVMVQKIFDNFSQTKRILGRFILSQIGNLFSVEEVFKIMGDEWVSKNFSEPVMAPTQIPGTGQMVMAPKTQPNGQPAMQVNKQKAEEMIRKVLSDTRMNKYHVSVGENISGETLKYVNYLLLMDMAEKGFPIPPEVIIDESTLNTETKEKIKQAMMQQQSMAPRQPLTVQRPKQGGRKGGHQNAA